MIRIVGPARGHLAVSGGVDSMVALHFLTRGKTRVDGVIHVNHGTAYGAKAEEFVRQHCASIGVPCAVHNLPIGTEAQWSAGRRAVFSKYKRVMTAHHFDDIVEWYLYTKLRYGLGRITPYKTNTVVHPFALNSKSTLLAYAKYHDVLYCEDPTNFGNSNARAILRGIMPHLEALAPNIRGEVRKAMEDQYENEEFEEGAEGEEDEEGAEDEEDGESNANLDPAIFPDEEDDGEEADDDDNDFGDSAEVR